LCPLKHACAAQAAGTPEAYPVKKPKAARPHRHGTLFWLQRGDSVLLVRRPDKGLLGGMRALPTGPWSDAPPLLADAPADAEWQMLTGSVNHGFTHFTIDLAIAVAHTEIASNKGEWWPVDRLDEAGLPTVFAKAADVVRRRA
jgi:A/G-specific adenine glycosylase